MARSWLSATVIATLSQAIAWHRAIRSTPKQFWPARLTDSLGHQLKAGDTLVIPFSQMFVTVVAECQTGLYPYVPDKTPLLHQFGGGFDRTRTATANTPSSIKWVKLTKPPS